MTPHHTGPTHKPTRRQRWIAAVRLPLLEAEAREREREAYELALHVVDGGHDEVYETAATVERYGLTGARNAPNNRTH